MLPASAQQQWVSQCLAAWNHVFKVMYFVSGGMYIKSLLNGVTTTPADPAIQGEGPCANPLIFS